MCPGLDRWYFLGPLGLKSGWPEQPGGTQPAGVRGAAWGPGAGWGRWVVPGICLPWGPVRPWEQLGCRKVVGQAAGCGRDRAIVLVRSDLDYVEHLEEGGILTFQGGEQGAPLLPRLWPWCPPCFAVGQETLRHTDALSAVTTFTMADACGLQVTILFPVGRTRRNIPKSWFH